MKLDIAQINMFHPNLQALVQDLEEALGFEFTATSLHRRDDPGIHGSLPLRATDVRCRVAGVGVAIERFINSRWVYDPQRPNKIVALYHDIGQGAHLHLQVHPNTTRK